VHEHQPGSVGGGERPGPGKRVLRRARPVQRDEE
jgi:hypothetical protein